LGTGLLWQVWQEKGWWKRNMGCSSLARFRRICRCLGELLTIDIAHKYQEKKYCQRLNKANQVQDLVE